MGVCIKDYSVYQYLKGTPMTERDKREVGSKFWNEGKWNNFVTPFMPEDGKGMTLVDMGCNAGLFLQLAEEKGFSRVVGVDNNKEAVERGLAYRDRIKGNYEILNEKMEDCIDKLPVADYTILANAHYYFYIADWLHYLDKLQAKTQYVIIVTGEKRNTQPSLTSADLEDIRSYFSKWKEMGTVTRSPEGDPAPRKLTGICFKSDLERRPLERLDPGNNVQNGFWEDIDKGIDYHQTKYYRIIKHYRKEWTREALDKFFEEKMKLLPDVRENGLIEPLIVRKDFRILDGNHRFGVLKYLNYKWTIVRKV